MQARQSRTPQTGERLVFSKTAAETGGEVHPVRGFHRPRRSPAGGPRPSRPERALRDHEGHADPEDRRPQGVEAKAGDVVTIEPGQAHNFWNKTDEEVSFKVEVRPALKIESVIETMYGLAADGKTNRFGMPNPLRLAVIAKHHFDTVALPIVPVCDAARGARRRLADRPPARLRRDLHPQARHRSRPRLRRPRPRWPPPRRSHEARPLDHRHRDRPACCSRRSAWSPALVQQSAARSSRPRRRERLVRARLDEARRRALAPDSRAARRAGRRAVRLPAPADTCLPHRRLLRPVRGS